MKFILSDCIWGAGDRKIYRLRTFRPCDLRVRGLSTIRAKKKYVSFIDRINSSVIEGITFHQLKSPVYKMNNERGKVIRKHW